MNVPRIAFVLSGALLIVSLWDLVIAEPQKPAEPGVPPPAAGPKASPPGGRPSIVESYEEARERERLEMEGARSLLARLLRQRLASAESQLNFAEALHKEGRVPVTSVLFARQQVALAELDLAGNAHQRVAAHEKIVNIALETESTMKASGAAGVSTGGANYEFARSARLQAQAELIRECVNAELSPPGWPTLPLGDSADAKLTRIADDYAGLFIRKQATKSTILRTLWLHGKRVDDAALAAIADIPELSVLVLASTSTTEKGRTALKRRIPKLVIDLPQPAPPADDLPRIEATPPILCPPME